MNISKFKQNHLDVQRCICELRQHSKAGIAEHADEISRLVNTMSSLIKLHLAAEDKVLYPALQRCGDGRLARLGQEFQQDMEKLLPAYSAFARRWVTAALVKADPEGFRSDANTVLRALHARVLREDREFYPAIDRMATATAA